MKRISFFQLFILSGLSIPVLVGCAGLQRSSESGYAYRDEELDVRRDRRSEEIQNSATELGIVNSSALSPKQREVIELRIALARAEKTLNGRREREQYFRNKPYLRNDRERIEFLRLDSFETRQRWLTARGIQANTSNHPAEIQSLIDVNDITLGMTKQAVRDSWGEPESVDIAGNPMYGNERWLYSEQVSSAEGYQTEKRMVFFESGLVVGWEKR